MAKFVGVEVRAKPHQSPEKEAHTGVAAWCTFTSVVKGEGLETEGEEVIV